MKMTSRRMCISSTAAMAMLFLAISLCGAAHAAGWLNPTVTVDEIRFLDASGQRTNWTLLGANFTINATVRVEDTTPAGTAGNVDVTFRDESALIDTVGLGIMNSGDVAYAEVNWSGREPTGEHLIQVQVSSTYGDDRDNNSEITVHRAEVDIAIMSGEVSEDTITRGSSRVYRFDLTNEGTLADTYDLTVSAYNPNAWEVAVLDGSNAEIDSIDVDVDETVEVRLRVRATAAGAKDVAQINFTATSVIAGNVSDAEMTTTRIANEVLVVDGADSAKDSVVNYFTDALDAAGYTYDVQLARADPVTAGDLANYPVVVWSEPEGYLAQDEVDALTTYMGSGQQTDKRSIFLSGKKIATGLELTAWGRTFLHNKLQVDFSNSTTYATTLEGADDPIGSGLGLDISVDGAGDGARNQDYVDNVTARDAEPVFLFDGADMGGTRYEGNTFNVVFLSFGFEGINDEGDRETIMKRLMLYFQGGLHGYVVTMKDSKVRYIEGATVILEGTPYTKATNGNGYYFFSGIAPGEYTLTVRAEGFLEPTDDKEVDVFRGSVTPVPDFVLNIKPAEFNGFARDQDDQTVSDVDLLFEGLGTLSGLNYTDRTGLDGSYDISVAEGTFNIHATKYGHWKTRVNGVSALEGQGATWVNFTIYYVRRAGNVTGLIEYEGTPLEDIEVQITNNITVYTDEDGRIPLTMVPGAEYTVSIRVKEGTPAYDLGLKGNSTTIVVEEGTTVHVNMTLEAGAVGTLTGTVTDNTAELAPIEGATVELEEKETGTVLGSQGVTDSDGEYTITKIPVGEYFVRARRSGYTTQQKNVKIEEGETKTVDFVLAPGVQEKGSLIVRVVGDLGDPLVDIMVGVDGVGEKPTARSSNRTAAQARFDELEAGGYTVTVYDEAVRTEVVEGVEVKKDMIKYVDVEVVIRRPSISGTITDADDDPVEGALVVVVGTAFEMLTGPNGTYFFRLELGPFDDETFAYEDVEVEINASKAGLKPWNLTATVGFGDSAPGEDLRLPWSEQPNEPPVADAGGDMTAEVGERITLDASGSSDIDGEIVTFRWTIGNLSVEGNPLFHTFTAPGTYTVTLVVTDDDGATDEDTMTVTVKETTDGNRDNDDESVPMAYVIGGAGGAVVVVLLLVIRARSKKKGKGPEAAPPAQPPQPQVGVLQPVVPGQPYQPPPFGYPGQLPPQRPPQYPGGQ